MAARLFTADDLDELLSFVIDRETLTEQEVGSHSPEEIGKIAQEMLSYFDRAEFVEFDEDEGVFRDRYVD